MDTNLITAPVERDPEPSASPDEVVAVVQGDSAFAFDLYAQAARDPGNIFVSPYSIAAALSMALAGARGLTSEQMAEVLHVALPGDRFHAARDALDRTIMDVEPTGPGLEGLESLRIDIANSLWAQVGYEFREHFLGLLARHYGAGLRLVDYCSDPDGARIAINNWVAQATNRRIIDLVPSGIVNAMTRLVLVNAIYFKGNWLPPFSSGQTRPAEWRLLDGNHRTVPMMHTCRKYQFADGDGWKAVRLAYAGNASMLVLLPDIDRFDEVEARLDSQFLAKIHSRFSTRQVDLAMPRFELSATFSLATSLKALGMEAAFEPPTDSSGADLTGMSPRRELFIRDVVHQAFVSVDEQGTEAAAATALFAEAVSAAPPAKLHLNRPFVFAIQDDRTSTVLFIGRLLDPGSGS